MSHLNIVMIKPSRPLEEILLQSEYLASDQLYIRFLRYSLESIFLDENLLADLILCDYEILNPVTLEKLLALSIPVLVYQIDHLTRRNTAYVKLGLVDHLSLPEELPILEAHLLRIMRQKSERILLEKNYLSGLGTLAAGLAHEINNPVGYIQNNLAMLMKYVLQLESWVDITKLSPSDLDYFQFIQEDQQDIFQETNEGIHQITQIVNSLRAYSKVDFNSVYYELKLSDEIDHVLNLLASELYSHIEIEKEYQTEGKIILMSGNIGIALMNIIKNAFDALVDCKKSNLKLRIQLSEHENNYHLIFEDNGTGISESARRKIFEPFYTTKPIGSATGLGLSTVYRIIVEDHKGRVSCQSIEGEYTRFEVLLPATPI